MAERSLWDSLSDKAENWWAENKDDVRDKAQDKAVEAAGNYLTDMIDSPTENTVPSQAYYPMGSGGRPEYVTPVNAVPFDSQAGFIEKNGKMLAIGGAALVGLVVLVLVVRK